MATLISDDFNRTSTTSAGTASTGGAWTAVSGTWGTDGDNLYSVTKADNNIVTIETGSQSQDVTVTLAAGMVSNAFPSILLGYEATDKFYKVETNGGNGAVYIQRRFNNSTVVSSGNGVVANGATIRAKLDKTGANPVITVWVNGTQVLQATDTVGPFTTGTRMGFRHGAGAAGLTISWDDAMVTDGAAPVYSAPTTGLVNRWRADSVTGVLDGGNVTTWPALTGASVLTGVNTPTFVAAAIGGRPAIRTTRASAERLTTTGLTARAHPFTVVTVHSLPFTNTQVGAGDLQLWQSAASEVYLSTDQYGIWAGSSGIHAGGYFFPTNAGQVLEATLASASSSLVVNGTTIASGDASGTGLGTTMSFGGKEDASRPTDVLFSEVLIYDHALTSAEQTQLRTYVQEWYGFAAAGATPTETPDCKVRVGGALVNAVTRYRIGGVLVPAKTA